MSDRNHQQPNPPRPTPGWGAGKVVLILAGLGILIVGLCVGTGLLLWRGLTAVGRADRQLVEGPAAPGRFNTLQEKYAAISAAFNSDSVGVSHPELGPIAGLFDAIVAATRDGDHAAFARQVDTVLLLLEMNASGSTEPVKAVDEGLARDWLDKQRCMSLGWNRYKIARVQPHAGGGAALVYTYFWDPAGKEYKVLWWLVERDDGWKAYDWEILDFGVRASKQQAIFQTLRDDRLLAEYFSCGEDRKAAEKLVESDSFELAVDQIRAAEARNVPPALRDDAWLQIGNAWVALGLPAEAMACFRRVDNPEALPGAIYGQALCCQSWGRHEKALELTSRYEEMLGRGPELGRLKAQSLLALGRAAEAVAALRESLDLEPEQWQLLPWLGLALPEQQKSTLAEYVRRCPDPVATALWLAESFVADGDRAALEATGDLLAELAPDPATKTYLAGLASQLDGDLAAAADLYREALTEADANRGQRYLYRYLEAMLLLGQPVEGYLAAPDRLAAFAYLADCYTSGEYVFPAQVFAGLLNQHWRDQPDDPWLHYYAGILLAQQGRYDEAEQQYLLGMAKTEDEDVRAAFRYPRIWALREAGKALEAYKTIGPAPETFLDLAWEYRWPEDLGPERTAELETLVEAHRAACPGEPWLDFYAGVVAQNQQDYRQADRLFARGQQQTEDSQLRRACFERRLDARIASGEILSALQEVEPREQTFAYLALRLSGMQQRAELKSLLEAYRRLEPKSPELRCWRAELLWEDRDYNSVIRLLTPWSTATAGQYPDQQRPQLAQWLVRSCLRLGRTSEAAAAGEEMYEQGLSEPLILVSATRRDVPKTTELMKELISEQYRITDLYLDEDVGQTLRNDEFLPLRRECPPGLRANMSGASAVILLREARQPDQRQLRDLLAQVLEIEPTVDRLPDESLPDGPVCFVANVSGQVYCLGFGADWYEPDEEYGEYDEPLSPALVQAVQEHDGWMSIDASVANRTRPESQLAAVCRLAAALLDDNCMAVYFGDEGRAIAVGPDTGDLLISVQSAEDLSQIGQQLWLYRDTGADPAVQQAINQRRGLLPEFCTAFAQRDPQQEFLLKIQLRLGPGSEPRWVAVQRIARSGLGGNRFLAQFTSRSLLVPYFVPGEPISVETYEVVDWKHTGQPEGPAE